VLNQFTVLPEFTESAGRIAVTDVLLESFTSTSEIFREPCGLINDKRPLIEERIGIFVEAAPFKVRVPAIVCVTPASNVRDPPEDEVLVRFPKVVDPEIV
jgi:hypothetical protein